MGNRVPRCPSNWRHSPRESSSMNSQGSGQGAVLDSAYRLVDASHPALADPLSYTTNTPTVTVGGAPVPVVFSGLTPGAVGLYQVNVLVPAESGKGAAVPVSIGIGGPPPMRQRSQFSENIRFCIHLLSLFSRANVHHWLIAACILDFLNSNWDRSVESRCVPMESDRR